MSEFNQLVKIINDSEEDYQLIEISRYVENKYEGDKSKLRKLIRDKFRPNLDNYPHKPIN
jgi:hypothetical protein